MDAAEKAEMEMMLSMMQDTEKLKGWLKSSCTSAEVSGNEASMYNDESMQWTTAMPAPLTVCKSSDDSIGQLSTCDLPHQSSA